MGRGAVAGGTAGGYVTMGAWLCALASSSVLYFVLYTLYFMGAWLCVLASSSVAAAPPSVSLLVGLRASAADGTTHSGSAPKTAGDRQRKRGGGVMRRAVHGKK